MPKNLSAERDPTGELTGPGDDLGNLLRLGLARRGMTVAELSRLTEIPRRSLENYLAGEAKPGFDTLKKICTCLNLSADFFIFGDLNPRDDKFYSMVLGQIVGEYIFHFKKMIVKLDKYTEHEIENIMFGEHPAVYASKRARLLVNSIQKQEREDLMAAPGDAPSD